jgi:putative oxidoreductase
MTALAGRLLIAALFVSSGIWKITHFAITTAYFVRIGMPIAEAMAVLAIIIELGGGIALAIGWRLRWVAWGLTVFTLVATGLGHRFWEVDPAQFFNQLNHFLKNIAVVGGLLILAARDKA